MRSPLASGRTEVALHLTITQTNKLGLFHFLIYFSQGLSEEKPNCICQPCLKESHTPIRFSLARIEFCEIYIIWLHFTTYLSVYCAASLRISKADRGSALRGAAECGKATSAKAQFTELSIRVRAGVKLPLLAESILCP